MSAPTCLVSLTSRGTSLALCAVVLALASCATPLRLPEKDPSSFRIGPQEVTSPATIREAVEQGKAYLKLRIRGESHDAGGVSKDAAGVTIRTVLGYETAAINGTSLLVEAENVSHLGGEAYNNSVNGKLDRPAIADPSGTEVNQAYLQHTIGDTKIRGGRQRIILDNARFVGNVGWRQNEQTFDAVSATGNVGGVKLFWSWLANANRIFGEDHPAGDARMDSHLLNAKTALGEDSALTGYWYHLDFNRSSGMAALSTSTVGARFEGAIWDSEEAPVKVSLELAHQKDAGSNPGSVDAGYSHLALSGAIGPVQLKVGQETLDGSRSGNGTFSTPLATLHAFNGWADKFLVTPATGLQDSYISIGGTYEGTALKAVYHEFKSQTTSATYGQEIDFLATRPIDEDSAWGAKFADYDARSLTTDSRKAWLWYQTQF